MNLVCLVEKIGRANEEAAPAVARQDQLVRERSRDAEGAGAGDDQHRRRDGERSIQVMRDPQPHGEGESPQRENGRHVDGRQTLGDASEAHGGPAKGRTEDLGQGRLGKAGLRARGERRLRRVERPCRDRLSGGEGTRSTLPVDPVEGAVGPVRHEDGVDGNEVAGSDDQLVTRRDVSAWHDSYGSLLPSSRQERAHARVAEELTLVLLENSLLQEATEKHQRDEHAERIEERSAPDGVGVKAPRVPKRRYRLRWVD